MRDALEREYNYYSIFDAIADLVGQGRNFYIHSDAMQKRSRASRRVRTDLMQQMRISLLPKRLMSR